VIADKLTVQALLGRLWDEGIPATFVLERGEVDVMLRPNNKLTGIMRLLAEEELELSYNGSEVHVYDRPKEIGE